VNVLVGESDCGKSAIIRALNWVVSNKPSGDSFRSNWGGATVVYLDTNDFTIGRAKSEQGNNYSLIEQGKPTEYFNSFNQGIPEEIKNLLNISPLSLQSQFSSPFLLSMSSGEVAKYLNKIVHLDKIDLAISNINKTLRKENQDLNYAKEFLEEQKESIKQYKWLDAAEKELKELEELEDLLFRNRIHTEAFGILINQIEYCERLLLNYSEIKKAEEEVDKALGLGKKIKKENETVRHLTLLIHLIEGAEFDIIEKEEQLIKWEEEFKELMPDICPLCGRGG
jgi:DNA repair ATPase RecN